MKKETWQHKGLKITIDGQDCDTVAYDFMRQLQKFVEETDDVVLTFNELFEKIDKIWTDGAGEITEFEWVL